MIPFIPKIDLASVLKILGYVKTYWRELLIIILVLIIIFLRGCNKSVETSKPQIVVSHVKPQVRASVASPELVKHVFDSIYSIWGDSVRLVTSYRDRVKIINGDTIVVRDTVVHNIPECWNLYQKLLADLKTKNIYKDTIYVTQKKDTTGMVAIHETVQDNKILDRSVWVQGFESETHKKLRLYIGLMGGSDFTGSYSFGPTVVFGWRSIGLGYSNISLFPKYSNYHNFHLYYNVN